MEKYLHEKLTEYQNSDYYAFHMPGHKGLNSENKIDITEISGFDNLHEPAEVLLLEQERIARIYNADKSYILVGGSTLGNLACIYSQLSDGAEILIDRNCHKSVYHAAEVRRCRVSYINQFNMNSIKEGCNNHPKAKMLVITSPTYEGKVADIKAIADIVHKNGMLLLVDCAHGAHLGFNMDFPENPVRLGADMVVMSLHKTLPAMTMTAVLHTKGDRVNDIRMKRALDIFETSSPSYMLMNSVSECMSFIENEGKSAFEIYSEKLDEFYEKAKVLKHLRIEKLDKSKFDKGKIIIQTADTSLSGPVLMEIFREKYHLNMEMCGLDYVLAMTSVKETLPEYKNAGLTRLIDALIEIDGECENSDLSENGQEKDRSDILKEKLPEKRLEIWEAKAMDCEIVWASETDDFITGRVAYDMVACYPPGSPIVVPGEIVDKETFTRIKESINAGLEVNGVTYEEGKIGLLVVKEA